MSESKAKLQAKLQSQERIEIIRQLGAIGHHAVKWISLAAISYFSYRSIEALAGKLTLADIKVNILQRVAVSVFQSSSWHEWIEYALIIGLLLWGQRQRKLRRDTIERLQSRIQELETKLDPNRSSSRLTKRGTTSPGDEP